MAETHREEIEKLEALYASHPEGRIFTHLAEAYRKAGELDRAREILAEGIQRHPDYPSAHVVFGRVMLDGGDTSAAAVAFRRVLELDRHNLVALRELGELAVAADRPAEALHYYRELRALDPGNDELRRIVGDLETTATLAGDAAPIGEGWSSGPVQSAYFRDQPQEADDEPQHTGGAPPERIGLESLASAAGFAPEPVYDDADDEVEVVGPPDTEESDAPTYGLPGVTDAADMQPIDSAWMAGTDRAETVPDQAESLESAPDLELLAEDSHDLATGQSRDEDTEPDAAESGDQPAAPSPWWETAAAATQDVYPVTGNELDPPAIEEEPGAPAEDVWVPQDRWDRFSQPTGANWDQEPSGEVADGTAGQDEAAGGEEATSAPDTVSAEHSPVERVESGPSADETDADRPAGDADFATEGEMADFHERDEAGMTEGGETDAGAEAMEIGDDGLELGEIDVEVWPGAEDEPLDEMVTETMAEVYASQGLTERAVEVYRQLCRMRPHDDRIVGRLAELEEVLRMPMGIVEGFDEEAVEAREAWLERVESAWTGGEGAATAGDETLYGWSGTRPGDEAGGGTRVGDYFRALLSWRPAGPDSEVNGAESAPQERGAAAGGEEGTNDAADEELLLMEEVPAPSAESGPVNAGAVEAAFDEWFGKRPGGTGEAGVAGELGGGAGEPREAKGSESEEDLEMFRTWLQSLKK